MRLLKQNLLKLGISFAIALGLAYLYVSFRITDGMPLVEWYRMICDAFTIPGLLFLMLGLLVTLSNQGALDGIGYAATVAFKMLIGAGANQERYTEYLERRRANRLKGYGFLYIVGIVCMAVALVCLALFYSIYTK